MFNLKNDIFQCFSPSWHLVKNIKKNDNIYVGFNVSRIYCFTIVLPFELRIFCLLGIKGTIIISGNLKFSLKLIFFQKC